MSQSLLIPDSIPAEWSGYGSIWVCTFLLSCSDHWWIEMKQVSLAWKPFLNSQWLTLSSIDTLPRYSKEVTTVQFQCLSLFLQWNHSKHASEGKQALQYTVIARRKVLIQAMLSHSLYVIISLTHLRSFASVIYSRGPCSQQKSDKY